MAAPHHPVDGGNKLLPGTALGLQELAPGRREPVAAAAPLTVFLEPAAAFRPEPEAVGFRSRAGDTALRTINGLSRNLPGIEPLCRWLDLNISCDARRLRNRLAEFTERF
jgi:hypothetical protein